MHLLSRLMFSASPVSPSLLHLVISFSTAFVSFASRWMPPTATQTHMQVHSSCYVGEIPYAPFRLIVDRIRIIAYQLSSIYPLLFMCRLSKYSLLFRKRCKHSHPRSCEVVIRFTNGSFFPELVVRQISLAAETAVRRFSALSLRGSILSWVSVCATLSSDAARSLRWSGPPRSRRCILSPSSSIHPSDKHARPPSPLSLWAKV